MAILGGAPDRPKAATCDFLQAYLESLKDNRSEVTIKTKEVVDSAFGQSRGKPLRFAG